MTLDDIPAMVAPYTMVPETGVRFTVEQTIRACDGSSRIGGVLVECGVWKGGCGLAMLLAQRDQFGKVVRPVHFMDSFSGMPEPTDRDGPAARAWQADTAAPAFRDNCRASRAELDTMLQRFGFRGGGGGSPDYHVWEGLLHDTLPDICAVVDRVALLRIDCDWYNSVFPCLDALVPKVSRGGIVILDDYYAWDGCARAVHDYLSLRDLPYRIRSLPDCSAAYLEKP